jgi:hypothetical protein
MKTDHPPTKAMLHALIEAAPQAISVVALKADPRVLLAAAMVGVVDLHTMPWPLTTAPGPKPVASPLARYQIEQGLPITTLHHATLALEDPIDRRLVSLLDGTRTRAALKKIPDLASRLARLAKSGILTA